MMYIQVGRESLRWDKVAMVGNGLYTSSTVYIQCVCLSPFCCHTLTYGVDNDDVLNPLAAIPASVSRDHHPPHTVTAILIPPHDEVCLTLPIPNDLLVFLEVRLNAFFFV